jgi:putative oxidoreductase
VVVVSWALLPLRLVIGLGFVLHAQAKLARGTDHFVAIVAQLGMPRPAAWAAIFVELAGGIAVLAGAYLRYVSLALAGILVAAIASVHWQYGFSSVRLLEVSDAGPRFGPVGYELALVYLASLAALALARPTPWSVDRWRGGATVRRAAGG